MKETKEKTKYFVKLQEGLSLREEKEVLNKAKELEKEILFRDGFIWIEVK